MATREQLYQAFYAAKEAGDQDGSQVILDEIKRTHNIKQEQVAYKDQQESLKADIERAIVAANKAQADRDVYALTLELNKVNKNIRGVQDSIYRNEDVAKWGGDVEPYGPAAEAAAARAAAPQEAVPGEPSAPAPADVQAQAQAQPQPQAQPVPAPASAPAPVPAAAPAPPQPGPAPAQPAPGSSVPIDLGVEFENAPPGFLESPAPIIRGAAPTVGPLLLGAGVGALLTRSPAGAGLGARAASVYTLLADPIVMAANAVLGTRVKTNTEAWNTILDKLDIPRSESNADKLLEAITAGGVSMVSSVGTGQLLKKASHPIAQAIGKFLAANPKQQVVAGMGAGAGSELAGQAIELGENVTGEQLPEGLKTAARLTGGLVGGVTGAIAGKPRSFVPREPTVPGMTQAAAKAAVAEAEVAGRPLMTSDVYPPSSLAGKKWQRRTEGYWLGTNAQRAASQEGRKVLAQEIMSDFGASVDSTALNDVMASLNSKRAADLAAYSSQKNSILNTVASTATPMNVGELRRTLKTINDEIKALNNANRVINAPAVQKLRDFKSGLLGDEILDPVTGAIVGYKGKSIIDVDANLKLIGESLAKDPSLAHIKSSFQKVTQRVYTSLKKDVRNYIEVSEGPAAARSWQEANYNLREMIKEQNVNVLRSVLKTGTATPENVAKILFSTKPSEVALLAKNLDPAGLQRAKAALISEAARRSNLLGTDASLSVFVKEVEKLGKQIGIIFTPADKQLLQGKIDYLKLTARSGEFALDPATGARLEQGGAMALLVTLLGPAKGMAAAASPGLIGRAYESALTRKLLMSLPKLKAGSPEQFSALRRIKESLLLDERNQVMEGLSKEQLTFKPENTRTEQFPEGQGIGFIDDQTGYQILNTVDGRFGLFGRDNNLIEAFRTKEAAQKRAEQEIRKNK
ncbi:hypothetical protein UFOVP298_17 [uncultured Caudovirales phage]|uniref:Uncharacterized protein n=1 Tax=uncultured Caudovirales phage TaxID=2100421 RepID=A0A6J5MUZ3_9CAUD|nr:hypothetical protein UFOVP298_17 [uncultured Caudovirales phage]CAB4150734.1 hypothetical protein UFOVP572_22 [uncultured Caudovirales phage]